MTAATVLHVQRFPGRIQYRLETSARSVGGPVRQVVTQPVSDAEMAALQDSTAMLLRGIPSTGFLREAEAKGTVLYHTLVPELLRHELSGITGPLLVSTSCHGIPFELFRSDEFWSLRYALGRQILLERAPRSRPSARENHVQLRALIILADPLGDLPYVHREGKRLFADLQHIADVEVIDRNATFDRVVTRLGEGFDVVHYCGHIVSQDASSAGLLLAERRVLTSAVIERTLAGSPVVFLNGCASSTPDTSNRQRHWDEDLSSVTYGFILGGARAVIGTTSDVSDGDATSIAGDFYRLASEGEPLGEALRQARVHARKAAPESPAWLSFALYGDPTLSLRTVPLRAPTPTPRSAPADVPSSPVAPRLTWRWALPVIALVVVIVTAVIWLARPAARAITGTITLAATVDDAAPPRCERPALDESPLDRTVWVCVSWFGVARGGRYLVEFKVIDENRGAQVYRKQYPFTGVNDIYHVTWAFEPKRTVHTPGTYLFQVYLNGEKRLEAPLTFVEETAAAPTWVGRVSSLLATSAWAGDVALPATAATPPVFAQWARGNAFTTRHLKLAVRTSTRGKVSVSHVYGVQMYEKRFAAGVRTLFVTSARDTQVRSTLLVHQQNGRPDDMWYAATSDGALAPVSPTRRSDVVLGNLTFADVDLLLEMPGWTDGDSAPDGAFPPSYVAIPSDGPFRRRILSPRLFPRHTHHPYAMIAVWGGTSGDALPPFPKTLAFWPTRPNVMAPPPALTVRLDDVETVGGLPIARQITIRSPELGLQTRVTVADLEVDGRLLDSMFDSTGDRSSRSR